MSAAAPRPAAQWGLLLAVLAFGALLRAPLADIPLERDEGEYAYVAQRWLLGEVPYKDAFDQKPPGVFALYALVLAWLGGGPAAVHWAAQAYTSLTAVLLFLLGRKLFSPHVGILAAALLLLTTADHTVTGNAANTETVMILPLVAALLATLEALERPGAGWPLLAGALSAAALLGKQVALPNLVFHAGLLALFAPRPRRQLLLFGAAAAAVLGAVVASFAAAGALAEFWDCVIGFNLSYVSEVPLYFYPGNCLEGIWDLSQDLAPVVALAALGLAGLVDGRRGPGGRRLLLIAGGWLAFSLLGVSVGGEFRGHYFIQLLPPACLLAAAGAVRLAGWPGLCRLPGAAYGLAGLCVAFAVLAAPWYYLPGPAARKARQMYGYNPFPEAPAVGRLLREHSRPDETVFVFGSEPQLYFYAERRCASRYMYVYPLMKNYAGARGRQREVLGELGRRPPRLVVDVNESASFLADEHCPGDLAAAVAALRRSSELVAVVLRGDLDRDIDLVTPASGAAAWERARRAVAEGWHLLAVYRRPDAASPPGGGGTQAAARKVVAGAPRPR